MTIAIGFDFDHTLGLDHGLERRAFVTLAERLGSPWDVNDIEHHAKIEELLGPFRRGEAPMDTMIADFTGTLTERTRLLDADSHALAAMFREICLQLADELSEPLPGARETIDALVALGVPIAILTNGWSPLQERKIARALGTFPGPVLVSDAIGAYKPARVAFDRLAAALATDVEHVWYVGDNPLTDVAGARAAGMRAVWFDGGDQKYGDVVAPDARITQLRELIDLVRGA